MTLTNQITTLCCKCRKLFLQKTTTCYYCNGALITTNIYDIAEHLDNGDGIVSHNALAVSDALAAVTNELIFSRLKHTMELIDKRKLAYDYLSLAFFWVHKECRSFYDRDSAMQILNNVLDHMYVNLDIEPIRFKKGSVIVADIITSTNELNYLDVNKNMSASCGTNMQSLFDWTLDFRMQNLIQVFKQIAGAQDDSSKSLTEKYTDVSLRFTENYLITHGGLSLLAEGMGSAANLFSIEYFDMLPRIEIALSANGN